MLGAVKHPLNASDFSSFLLQAQDSKAKIIGLANAGGDTINAIKQAAEFGIVSKGQKMAGLLVFITDVNALGLATAQGLMLSESFYWDRDDKTRAWSKRFAAKRDGAMPTMVQAGVYAAIRHYLKAIAELKNAQGRQGGRREDGGDPDRRPAVRQGHDRPQRPQAPLDVRLRGQDARRSRRPSGTTTS